MNDGPMIDTIDHELGDWLTTIVPKAGISFAPPPAEAGDKPLISCYLLALASAPPTRSAGTRGPAPQQFALRYLVSVSAGAVEDAHRVLGPLVFAAMDRPGCEVEFDMLPGDLWLALGVKPRPAFILRVPVRLARPEPAAGIVLHPIVINEAPLRSLSGRVVGPGDVPLAGARLELPSLGLAVRSDHRGRFTFPPIPIDPLPPELVISARGRVLRVAPAKHLAPDHTLTITFPIPEN
jgi:hypothetical protein